MSPRILPFVCLLGACAIPSIPQPEPLPPLPPPVRAAEAEPPPAAAPTPVAEVVAEAVAAVPAARVHPPETVALFVANCAQCHGEKGDGEGVTQLDRKARSFLDGGFSYGNTPDAIFRSITHGIPGTPMPGFEKPLSEAQRRELASYVIALGPADQIVVDAKDSEMVVRDMALIVRGKLPPIAEGSPEWPRGLAIGLPEGLTFEYRADDVQLLAVRAGRFVNRKDWGGRGGDPLELLGKIVWKAPSPACLFLAGVPRKDVDAALTNRLRSTNFQGGEAWITYDSFLPGSEPGSPPVAHVRETMRALTCDAGSGFVRELIVEVGANAPPLEFIPIPLERGVGLRMRPIPEGQYVNWGETLGGSAPPADWIAISSEPGAQPAGPGGMGWRLASGAATRLCVAVLPGVRLQADSPEEFMAVKAAFEH